MLTREWTRHATLPDFWERKDQNGMTLSAIRTDDGTWKAVVQDDVIIAEQCKTADVARTTCDKKVYCPGRTWGPNPQSSPDLFHDADIMREVRYLMGLNKRHGSHPLRTVAYSRLLDVLSERAKARTT